MSMESQESGIKIEEVRIRNFRSLQEVNVSLDWLTILIGENNSGKTSFLEALFAAIGAGNRSVSVEDIFLAPSEKTVPKDREVIIDLLIRPNDYRGNIIDTFSRDSYWLALWGEGVSQDDNENDFVGIRTRMMWNSTRNEYVTERKFLGDWQIDSKKWDQSKIKDSVFFNQIEPLALYLMDAKRDIKDELQSRNSFWYKMVSDPGLDEEHIEDLEIILTKLNEEIVSGSEVLAHVQNNLDDIYKTIRCDKGSVHIAPIPRHLRDLSKGMDVNFATKGAQTFPLSRHGMGTRSLAAVLIFRAYTTWRQKKAMDDRVHPMLALEEPESHLHPQAQRALFTQIEQIPGQRIISTHSPYIAGQSKIYQFRHFRKADAVTTVTQMDINVLDREDLLKIDRMVMNTRGELLYAHALVFCEGEQTEDQALPIFAEKYWNQHPNTLGITMIGVGGDGNYLPFLRLASHFQIPWYIFSDGEPLSIKRVQAALSKIGITDYTKHPNVVVLPNKHNFESYLVAEKYEAAILTMLDSYHSTANYLDTYYIPKMHGQQLNKSTARDYKSSGGRERALVNILSENKTQYGKPIAEAITNMSQESLRFPVKIRELFEKMSGDLGLEKRKV